MRKLLILLVCTFLSVSCAQTVLDGKSGIDGRVELGDTGTPPPVTTTCADQYPWGAGFYGYQCDGPAQLPDGINSDLTGDIVGIVKTMPTVTGSTYNVTSGNAISLQSQINAAATDCSTDTPEVVIPVATYTVTSLDFPATNCAGGNWVVVRTANLANIVPQGTRVSSSDYADMPIITTPNPSSAPTIIMRDSPGHGAPNHYWLVGLDIQSNDTGASVQNALALVGDGCASGSTGCPITPSTTISQLTNYITFDRCHLHGASSSSNVRHGLMPSTASHLLVRDSVIDEIHDLNLTSIGQTTGINSDFSFGYHQIENTEIAALTENVIYGATDPAITNLVPTNILYRNDYIHKPASWFSNPTMLGNMRNWFECKSCSRLLIIGSVFDGNSGQGQSTAMQFTPRNSGGNCTWCTIRDVTIALSSFKNLSGWLTVLGANDVTIFGGGKAPPSKRFSVHDNTIENIDEGVYGAPSYAIGISMGDGSSSGCPDTPGAPDCVLSDLSIQHNTLTGSGLNSALVFVWGGAGVLPANTFGLKLNISNNILAGGAYILRSDATVTGGTSDVRNYFNSNFTTWTFDGNVITNIGPSGFTTNWPSPACNQNSGSGCSGPGFATAMSNVNFCDFNSGLGGDYHLGYDTDIPYTGCVASPYWEKGTDALNPGANIDSLNDSIRGVETGSYEIAASQQTGPYTDASDVQTTWIRFPGYYQVGNMNGSSDGTTYGFTSINETYSGIARFFDLKSDVLIRHNIGGFNVGLMDTDYYATMSQPCGFGTGISDSKPFYGVWTTIENNAVRMVMQYEWSVQITGTHLPPVTPPEVVGRDIYTFYRGKIYHRLAFDNSCGSSIALDGFQYAISNYYYNFAGQPSTLQYPPSYGSGYSEAGWQANPCFGGGFSYIPCIPSPWGYVGVDGLTVTGVEGHSIWSGANAPQDYYAPWTPGYTNYYQHSNTTYPVNSTFLRFMLEDSNASYAPYQASNGIGVRSKLQTSITIPSSGDNSIERHSMEWVGDNNITTQAETLLMQDEYLNPPTPTLTAGSSISFDYGADAAGGGNWIVTADGTPKVAMTATGDMYCPAFVISSWNNTVPSTIRIDGATVAKDVGFVAVDTDATHLLIHLINRPQDYDSTKSPALCPTIESGTTIQIP